MRESDLLPVAMAILAALVVLAACASGACSSCAKEADWSETASAFISGTPMSEDPIPFGPKAARAESSQFEREAQASTDTTESERAESSLGGIALQSVNATPATVNSTNTTKIVAVFAINDSERQGQGGMQISASATIKDSAGAAVKKLNLIKTSANVYYNDWIADVPPGIYSVDISASSLDGAASFQDALQIEVVGSETGEMEAS
ncbi:MAG: hypothetical protein MUE87_03750 [Methanothrix sp.]|nr:hypothetical protein [Methanothrix sp.]